MYITSLDLSFQQKYREKPCFKFRDNGGNTQRKRDENNAPTIKINRMKSNLLKKSQQLFIANHSYYLWNEGSKSTSTDEKMRMKEKY